MSQMARIVVKIVRPLFSLRRDTDYEGTIRQVRNDSEFHSGNIWSLVFAILIASVGLNVNSTAVIIGAMLISPLMGPIVGAGFALATNDFPLLRRSARNLLIATVVALIASTLYFAISPLEDAQSELLARTRPTLYDVLIALFGGGAGAVAGSRQSKMTNAVPGVAIATALMPPLCTAGFGMAQGNLWYTLGALHLYLINALFICLSTLAFVRLMHFEQIQELGRTHLMRTRLVIIFTTLCIAVPSIYTGWTVVQEARFLQSARQFVADKLVFTDRSVLNVEFRNSGNEKVISATLLGHPLPAEVIDSLSKDLPRYGLEGTKLVLNQPVEGQASIEQVGQMVRQGILEDLYKRNEEAIGARDARIKLLENEVVRLRSADFPVRELTRDCGVVFPGLVSLAVGQEVLVTKKDEKPAAPPPVEKGETDSTEAVEKDDGPTVVIVATWEKKVPKAEEINRMEDFLEVRLKVTKVRLVNATR